MFCVLTDMQFCIFMKRWPHVLWTSTYLHISEPTGMVRTPELQVASQSCPRICKIHCSLSTYSHYYVLCADFSFFCWMGKMTEHSGSWIGPWGKSKTLFLLSPLLTGFGWSGCEIKMKGGLWFLRRGEGWMNPSVLWILIFKAVPADTVNEN